MKRGRQYRSFPPHFFNALTFTVVITFCLRPDFLYGQESIVLNQLGYRPRDNKIAFVRDPASRSFELVDAATHKTVYKNKLPVVGVNAHNTGETLFPVDFSNLRTPGRYLVRIPETNQVSPEFDISDTVYNFALRQTIRGFTFQRCGSSVGDGTNWYHPPCHTKDAVLYDNPSVSIETRGGWHDAGDYGKYVATAAVSAAFLLYLYEDRASTWGASASADAERWYIIDEAKWELLWLLKMQRNDGAVYHKLSTKKWNGEHLPQNEADTRYIFGTSTTATGAFAAVTALASRQLDKADPQLSAKLLHAAVAAWNYLAKHPDIDPPGGFRNPSDVEGGEYGDANDNDERLWAAVELFRTTQNEEYSRYFDDKYGAILTGLAPVSWEQVQNFAFDSYLKMARRASNDKVRGNILAKMSAYGNTLVDHISSDAYHCVLGHDQFYWGSNSVVAGYTFDLLCLYRMTNIAKFRDAAMEELHYLLGRNTFGLSFVTGVGSTPSRHPYHQFSMMLGTAEPVPGLLVGGPNAGARLHGEILSSFPGRCYEDNVKNYYVNEVAINYSAPFAYLSGYFFDANPSPSKSGSSKGGAH